MKIIYDNVLHGGTYSATNESLNYPVENLDHPFITKRFQATGNTSTVTIILDTAASVDSIGHGVTNATAGTIRVYSGAYDLEATLTMDRDYDPCITYTASTIAAVTKIEIDLTTTDTYAYLGGVSAGVAHEIDYAYAQIERPLTDNTAWQQMPGGQSLSNKKTPLRNVPLTFDAASITAANNLITVYRSVGLGTPMFIEFFEGARTIFPPLFCCFATVPVDTGSGYDRTITVNFRECK